VENATLKDYVHTIRENGGLLETGMATIRKRGTSPRKSTKNS
jgi:hypothetical protein